MTNEIDNNLINGINYISQGDFGNAIRELNFVLGKDPGHYEANRHLGLIKLENEDYDEAEKLFIKSLERHSLGFESLTNLARLKILKEDLVKAESLLEKSYKINKQYLATLLNFCDLYFRSNKRENCLKYAIEAIRLAPKDPMTISKYSKALIINSREKEAIDILEKLIAQYPVHDFLLSLADAYLVTGNIEKSNSIVSDVFMSNDKNIDAFLELTKNKKNKIETNQLRFFEDFCKDPNNPVNGKITVCEALFNYFKNTNEIDKSSKYLVKMNQLQFNKKIFNIKNCENFIDFLKSFNLENVVIDMPRKVNVIPIFICGMPRSGTTLCEQILSSHSNVTGAGEITYLTDILGIKSPIETDEESTNNLMRLSTEKNYAEEVRKTYFQSLLKHRIKNTRYICDKLPYNFFYINIIKKLFPESKIIYCSREPMDNCFSLYKTKFHLNSHQYSYDQKMLAEFYLLHKKLMGFYTNQNYKKIYNFKNESLLNNQRQVTSELLKFCDLNWEENCINYHKNTKSVTTASLRRVREPLNRDALGAWFEFKSSLEILQEGLKSE
tara:strand:- start:3833 stop:5497 length:1665 start_codon:yes stop_codon:yes gene_type:complete